MRTNTHESIVKLGEEHGAAQYAPLPRSSFETAAFYAAYMEGYERGKPRPTVSYSDPWAGVPLSGSGLSATPLLYYDLIDSSFYVTTEDGRTKIAGPPRSDQ